MSHILTNTGRYLEFDLPYRHPYTVDEIASALSKLCRFTGHVNEFYSVAQHSVMVSAHCPDHLKLAGLLHDASEAYLGDVASPLKRMLPDYKTLEDRVEAAIYSQFLTPGLYPLDPVVKHVDMQALITERRQLMPVARDANIYWPDFNPLPVTIIPLNPDQAYRLFMETYQELTR